MAGKKTSKPNEDEGGASTLPPTAATASASAASSRDDVDGGDDKKNQQHPTKKNKKKSVLQKSNKKSGALANLFSLSALSSFAAIFYVYFAFSNLVNLMYPLRNVPREVLENAGDEGTVYPLWGREVGGGVGGGRAGEGGNIDGEGGGGSELGLRVYLSSEPQFSLNYFSRNDRFGANDAEDRDGTRSVREGDSFLLWAEDNAPDATRTFPSRSFVLVASDDDDDSASCDDANGDGGKTCSKDQREAQKSLEFAHRWLEDSIKHEKQLESDGGGLMAAMNSAGGGIESTSVLLTFYTSLHRNLKRLADGVVRAVVGGGDGGDHDEAARAPSSEATRQQGGEVEEDEEPRTVIRISPQNPLWRSLMSDGDVYVHVVLVRQVHYRISSSPDPRSAAVRLQQLNGQHNVLLGRVGMVKRELPLHVPSPKRLLYRDLLFVLKRYVVCPISDDGSCGAMVPPWDVAYHQTQAAAEYKLAREHKKEGVKYPYWKPEVSIHLIQDDEGYPLDYSNRVGFEIVKVGKNDGKKQQQRGSSDHSHPSGYAYLPAVHVDEIGLTSDKYVPLNGTVSALPLRIGFRGGAGGATDSNGDGGGGLTPARYRLLNHMASALESQAEMGFEQSDIDDLRRLIAETNVMLLAVTVMASVFHLLFEFLTFKSDVDFWRGNTDLTGLSVRALFLDWLSQVVILFYLIEMDSSLLMTIPTAAGMLIALWKCQRGAGLKFVKTGDGMVFGYSLCATRLRASAAADPSSDGKSSSGGGEVDLAALTEEMDQLATRLLGRYFLLPLVFSYAVYSLVKEPHAGWYSWFITTSSSFVYAIGFVLMTPQLFLNYKLKSVAHLPWKVLCYRFVNTFIDDLFAFIIRMPTMARMSCFRDDVVFIIYLYQRYLYPVDASRPVEGGGVGDVVAATPVESGKKNGKKKQS